MLLTHLHFDHVGGAVERDANGLLKPAFPNAQRPTCERHWDWAINPNPREKASLSENLYAFEESGQLRFIDRNGRWNREPFGERFLDWTSSLPMATPKAKCSPSSYQGTRGLHGRPTAAAHLPMAWVIGTTPARCSMEEKALLLDQAHREDWMLFFEHDATNACLWKAPRKEFEPPASLPALKKLGLTRSTSHQPLVDALDSAGPS